MAESNRRDFLKKGATAMLGVGAVGTLSAAACVTDPGTATTAGELEMAKFALNEAKYRQLVSFPDVRKEFLMALDEVAEGLMADPNAYASFMETSDAVGSLKVWAANEQLLKELVGETDGTLKQGRLKRILVVSELYDANASLEEPGFLDAASSSSSGGGCATNGSATNGCCVIHTWGWSRGDGLCSGEAQIEQTR